jgi:hypothetical protein
MALVVYDRVQQTGTANTTVSFTLSGSVTGFQSFAVVGNGNTTYYAATDASGNWEVGLGTYSTTGPTLTRTTILSSSNSNLAVTFSGTCNIFVTYPSSTSVYEDTSGNVTPLGTITSGTWNATTIGVAYGGTGVTASSGANSVMLRDASQNVAINRLNQANTNTAAAAGVTTLTAASAYSQTLTGTGTQTFRMPDATTLSTGVAFIFNNNATGTLTLQDSASGAIGTITAGGAVELICVSTATAAGTWDYHGFLPENVTWGTNALAMGSTIVTGGTWQGGTIQSGYGGTGLTTFTAANNALYSTSASALVAGTLPVLAGGTGVTTSTGSGNNVLSTSPTLVTPALGTPSSGIVTNLTGTASININGTVGATTPSTGAFTSITASTTLGITGVATFSAGTVSLPAITTTGDTNTGIYFPAADTIAFTEGGVEAMRIDSSGNLLVGGTSALASSAGRGNITINGSSTSILSFGSSNVLKAYIYSDGTNFDINNQAVGYMTFQTSGTERMRISSDGYVNIGTTLGTANAMRLGVLNNIGIIPTTQNTVGSIVTLQSALGSSSGEQILTNEITGYVNGSNYATALRFYTRSSTAAVEAMRITSAGGISFGSSGTAYGTSGQVLTSAGNASPTWATPSTVNNGTLTMNVSGTGLSGSQTFTANQSSAATFTVTSNATSANTASTIVARDASGNFTAGTITAALTGNASTATSATTATTATQVANALTLAVSGTGLSGSASFTGATAQTFTVTSNATNANTASTIVARDASGNFTAGTITASLSGSATSVVATVTGTNSTELVRGNMADNDQFRILVGGTGSNSGFAEIATADDGSEPIYVRQYTGTFTSLVRTANLLDGSGNTSFPGSITGSSFSGAGTGLTGTASSLSIGGNAATATTAAGLSATLVATSGGTGQSSYAVGDILYASTTTALSKLADVATGNALISGGVGVAPSWGKIGLTTHVSGTLPIANGGTNATATPTAGGAVYGTGTAYAITAAGTAGQVLTSNGASAPTWGAAPTATAVTLPSTNPFVQNATTLSANLTITGNNAMAAGPITINTSVTLTISTGCRVVIV